MRQFLCYELFLTENWEKYLMNPDHAMPQRPQKISILSCLLSGFDGVPGKGATGRQKVIPSGPGPLLWLQHVQ